jgi:hypothetical protein
VEGAEIELAASKGRRMTIQFEKLKARLLANPEDQGRV